MNLPTNTAFLKVWISDWSFQFFVSWSHKSDSATSSNTFYCQVSHLKRKYCFRKINKKRNKIFQPFYPKRQQAKFFTHTHKKWFKLLLVGQLCNWIDFIKANKEFYTSTASDLACLVEENIKRKTIKKKFHFQPIFFIYNFFHKILIRRIGVFASGGEGGLNLDGKSLIKIWEIQYKNSINTGFFKTFSLEILLFSRFF